MKLIKWGHDFELADQIFVIRDLDIKNKNIAKKIIELMNKSNTENPEKFFQEQKICFLATKENYTKFLLSLLNILEREKK